MNDIAILRTLLLVYQTVCTVHKKKNFFANVVVVAVALLRLMVVAVPTVNA